LSHGRNEADTEEDTMSDTTTATSTRTRGPHTVPQPRRAPDRGPATRTRIDPVVIDLREPVGVVHENPPEQRPTRGVRRVIDRLLGDRALTVEDRAHALAARQSHRSLRTEPLAAHAHLLRGLQ
jgi:hypothetical protein